MGTIFYRKGGRRDFIHDSLKITVTGLGTFTLLAGCQQGKEKTEDQKVSAPEDLMQEHGLLNRILLIYENCRGHLQNNETFPDHALPAAAGIIRTFVENYHEKQEENYLFPRFQKANLLTDLVSVLLQQHHAGRIITGQILQITGSSKLSDADHQKLIQLITSFIGMYRPHEAREDTVLFPAFRKLVSLHEYGALGEEFEKNEHQLFGQDGFETMVGKVEAIEKSLGICQLSQFTPQV